ncbi:hypothetical protein [Nocardioides dongkuii]|nr:hypothetical protein [Nocardioides dongkuii]
MNFIISALVGGVVAGVALVGGVQAYQGGDPEPVSDEVLYSYSDQ